MAESARPWRASPVWAAVADELRRHRAMGLGALMTEDVVRFCAVRALADAGVDAAGMRVEAPHPVVRGARVDLVIGHPKPAAVVEFKYPREPNPVDAAWTDTLGEVLKDFYRLAAHPGELDRVLVLAENAPLRAYLVGVARRHGLDLDADNVELRPKVVAGLRQSTRSKIYERFVAHRITARRLDLITVDSGLRLAVYEVDQVSEQREPAPAAAPQVREGARREILAAITAVLTREGATTFTPAEIVAEMTRRGTTYAESTIRTMITAHLCRNAPDNNAMTYDDLERVDRGRYRLAARA